MQPVGFSGQNLAEDGVTATRGRPGVAWPEGRGNQVKSYP
jgi:hypothetical protein